MRLDYDWITVVKDEMHVQNQDRGGGNSSYDVFSRKRYLPVTRSWIYTPLDVCA